MKTRILKNRKEQAWKVAFVLMVVGHAALFVTVPPAVIVESLQALLMPYGRVGEFLGMVLLVSWGTFCLGWIAAELGPKPNKEESSPC